MVTTGRVRNRWIELDTPLGLPDGTRVEVQVHILMERDNASLIGIFADESEVLDTIIAEVMHQREIRPLRLKDHEE
ncbi:MAG: hypothetical protein ACK4ME_11610 [Fimbriimonadales bacterium]